MSYLSLKRNRCEGFSLIELMVVISIIAVLVAFAHSKFVIFSAKAKQVEAKQNLSVIYTLTTAFLDENPDHLFSTPFEPVFYNGGLNGDKCGEKNELGFVVTNCPQARYYYGLESFGNGEFAGYAHSRAIAFREASPFLPFPEQPAQSGILPAWCNKMDSWSIDQNKVLSHIKDAIKECF